MFWANVVLVILVLCIGIWGALTWLASYTKHGETRTVPNVMDMPVEQAIERLEEANMDYAITEQHNSNVPVNYVFEQNPEFGSKVKENRTIYLLVTPDTVRMVKIPAFRDDVNEMSQREYLNILVGAGLEVGELIPVPEISDKVLELRIDGEKVEAGTEVEEGTKIDIVHGNESGNSTIFVPSLLGMTYEEAKWLLPSNSLNIGAVIFDETIGELPEDTMNAYVYRQYPLADKGDGKRTIKIGEGVDIWLTKEQPEADSTNGGMEPSEEDSMVALPDFIGNDLQDGVKVYMMKLTDRGFEVGELIPRPDIAEVVLDVQIDGESIEPGTMLPLGTTLDIVHGDRSEEDERGRRERDPK